MTLNLRTLAMAERPALRAPRGHKSRDTQIRKCRVCFSSRINWVLDCDIQSFFDEVNQSWLIRFVEHRIGDRRIIRLIAKWLTAGVLEGGHVIATEEGTPQGAVISPLLANIYLHYVYDLWVHQWRHQYATGDVIVVRYADDTIVGFEHRHEAKQFLADLKARFARFSLTLHPDKTRLIEFGRSAIADRRARGLGKPESFDFLGFTHYCATRRSGSGFVLGRKPVAKRMRTKLREIKEQLMAIRHEGTERQGRWLCQVLRGWMAYYAVPMSGSAISAFRHHVIERWHRALMRHSCSALWLRCRMSRSFPRCRKRQSVGLRSVWTGRLDRPTVVLSTT
jgi:RNA-directed DNA polymerase